MHESLAEAWHIRPNGPLVGEVQVCGSKNAVTKHMVAAMLGTEPSTIPNAPDVGVVGITADILTSLGVGVEMKVGEVTSLVRTQFGLHIIKLGNKDSREVKVAGIVLPIVAINKASGELESAPEVVQRGLAIGDDNDYFMQKARALVGEVVISSTHEERVDWSLIKEKIRVELKRFIQKETGRRPMIIPVVLEV